MYSLFNMRIFALLCGISLVLSCGKDGAGAAKVLIIVGSATVQAKGEMKPLKESQALRAGQVIEVDKDSKIKLSAGEAVVYAKGPARLNFEKKNPEGTVLKVDGGEVHVISGKNKGLTCEAAGVAATFQGADGSLRCGGDGTCVVQVLSGSVKVTRTGEASEVKSCTKVVFGGAEAVSGPLEEADILELKGWVGSSAVDNSIKASRCVMQAPQAENLPPEWVSRPRTGARFGARYMDTLEARDPEGEALHYSLCEGPAGMALDSVSGVLAFVGSAQGTYGVKVRAQDPAGRYCDLSFELRVEGALSLTMEAPDQVLPGKEVELRVVPLLSGAAGKEFTCRLDFDGDGKYDYPAGGEFGADLLVAHQFAREGEMQVRAEVAHKSGLTATVSRTVLVNSAPRPSLVINPATPVVGVSVELDGSGCSDARDSVADLLVRWDLDGDGTWDFPGEDRYVSEKRKSYAWGNPGIYKVGIQVRDRDGLRDSTWAQVEVKEELKPVVEERPVAPPVVKKVQVKSISGPKSAFVGQEVLFLCDAEVVGSVPIQGYRWSFRGENVITDKKSEKPEASMVFRMPGEYTVLCGVLGPEGILGSQQTTIRIVHSDLRADAHGPYSGQVNRPISFKGSAQTGYGGILAFEWDFEGDGKADFSSSEVAVMQHSYKKAGTYSAVLSVKGSGGVIVRDTARVTIASDPPVALAGEYIVSKPGRKVKLSGKGSDTDGQVVLYEWDFDGDGQFDWKSEAGGDAEHVFDVYSLAVLRVKDSDGLTSQDTVRIVVCPEGMATVEGGKFCIDRYEWPNARGTLPDVNVTWNQAQASCLKAGKRLCSAQEWEQACKGDEEKLNYPYGKKFDLEKCNTVANPYTKNSIGASGSFPDCGGSLSVFDMSGNVAEWTYSADKQSASVHGGFYQSGEKEGRCDSKLLLDKSKTYFYAGFRCCK